MSASQTSASRPIAMNLPRTLAFGAGCARRCAEDLSALGHRSILIITSKSAHGAAESLKIALKADSVSIFDCPHGEPTIDTFQQILSAARDARAAAVLGDGRGTAVDVAKLVAAFLGGDQHIRDVFGIGKLGA